MHCIVFEKAGACLVLAAPWIVHTPTLLVLLGWIAIKNLNILDILLVYLPGFYQVGIYLIIGCLVTYVFCIITSI